VDPIVRSRLQEEFLRLQANVRKTIVLVTHDLDEAVRLGDRIAVLSEGGILEQYDPPADLLGAPASDFVREFVGADRGIRRLAVTPIRDTVLRPVSDVEDDLPSVPRKASLYEALATMLTAGVDRVVVVGDDGTPAGLLHRDTLGEK
jgi:osmoprotectant transport system ATP-binding protein